MERPSVCAWLGHLRSSPTWCSCDEVTSSVDPAARRALEALARDLADAGTPVVWVTHDLAQARRLADTMLVVQDGRIAEPAEAEAFLEEGDRGE